MRTPNDLELWIKLGQLIFFGLLVYYCWEYIVAILVICGLYYLFVEWEKNNRKRR